MRSTEKLYLPSLRICDKRKLGQVCANVQTHLSLRCSHTQREGIRPNHKPLTPLNMSAYSAYCMEAFVHARFVSKISRAGSLSSVKAHCLQQCWHRAFIYIHSFVYTNSGCSGESAHMCRHIPAPRFAVH